MIEYIPPIEGMKTRPYGLPLMLAAWKGCIAWAAQEPEVLTRFISESGIQFKPPAPRSPIDRMIDSATGRDGSAGAIPENAHVFAAFADWVTINWWGEEEL